MCGRRHKDYRESFFKGRFHQLHQVWRLERLSKVCDNSEDYMSFSLSIGRKSAPQKPLNDQNVRFSAGLALLAQFPMVILRS